jgi:hypothetical protein
MNGHSSGDLTKATKSIATDSIPPTPIDPGPSHAIKRQRLDLETGPGQWSYQDSCLPSCRPSTQWGAAGRADPSVETASPARLQGE